MVLNNTIADNRGIFKGLIALCREIWECNVRLTKEANLEVICPRCEVRAEYYLADPLSVVFAHWDTLKGASIDELGDTIEYIAPELSIAGEDPVFDLAEDGILEAVENALRKAEKKDGAAQLIIDYLNGKNGDKD